MKELKRAAEAAVNECLALKEGERFLIVSNPGTEQEVVAKALEKAALARGIDTTLLLQPVKSQGDYAEDYVLEAIAAIPDALASISTEKLGKDPYRLKNPIAADDGRKYDNLFHYLLHGLKQMRAFWSPSTTIDMFNRTVAIDYALMKARAQALSGIMDEAIAFHVTAPSGTDVVVGSLGRKTFVDDGDFSVRGKGGNLPAGEVFISPSVKSTEGTIVFDGSIADISGVILIKTPIRCTVSGGYILGMEGGDEAERLERTLRRGMDMASDLVRRGTDREIALQYATNVRHIGELGIGLNNAARITGNMLEDEKVYGTCHFAIGSNYDEDAPAMIHLDGLVRNPTILALMPDGREITLMTGGLLA